MDRRELYESIAQRTGGDIYIGVVGPVRTGKSTFIKRFMDMLVIPSIDNEYERARVIDELPQSAAGKTIMTTQPKFVPNEAAAITLGENTQLRVRLVDCVGYMVPGAAGHLENEMPRMVRTPWSDDEMPFDKAAEIGTRKVITDHSTIGIVMTTDGSITQIPRDDYVGAEERVVRELREQGKPFIVVLNSTHPNDPETVSLALALREKYGVTVHPANVLTADANALNDMLELILMEFPLRTVRVNLPEWICELGNEHWLVERVRKPLEQAAQSLAYMRDYTGFGEALSGIEGFSPASVNNVSLGEGDVLIDLQPNENLFYTVLGEECGVEIKDDAHLIASLKGFAAAKREYDRIEGALKCAMQTGYGMVPPQLDNMEMEEPEIVRQGNRFGVRLRAHASGLHLIKVDMESEVSPLVGTEEQSEEFMNYLMNTFENNPQKIWDTNIFGKSLRDMVRESMTGKVNRLPDEVQQRLQATVQRMVNDGCNGLICIML